MTILEAAHAKVTAQIADRRKQEQAVPDRLLIEKDWLERALRRSREEAKARRGR